MAKRNHKSRNKTVEYKHSKTAGSKNPLIYDAKNSFYKYKLSEFVKTLSIESKFDTFYKEFIHLKDLDAKPENINHKFIVPNKFEDFRVLTS